MKETRVPMDNRLFRYILVVCYPREARWPMCFLNQGNWLGSIPNQSWTLCSPSQAHPSQVELRGTCENPWSKGVGLSSCVSVGIKDEVLIVGDSDSESSVLPSRSAQRIIREGVSGFCHFRGQFHTTITSLGRQDLLMMPGQLKRLLMSRSLCSQIGTFQNSGRSLKDIKHDR